MLSHKMYRMTRNKIGHLSSAERGAVSRGNRLPSIRVIGVVRAQNRIS